MNENKENRIDSLSEEAKARYNRSINELDEGIARGAVKHHHHSSSSSSSSSGRTLSGRAVSGVSPSGEHHSSGEHHHSSERSSHSSSSSSNKKKSKLTLPCKIILCVLSTVIIITATAFIGLKMIVGETSPAAKEMFVTTLLETGQMKWLASLVLSERELNEIVESSKLEKFSGEIDTSLIVIDGSSSHESGQTGESGGSKDAGTTKGIEIFNIAGRTFSATMMVVIDPSRITVGCISEFGTYGVTLDKIVSEHSAIGGINAGLYYSTNNSGGTPYGVVVEEGVIRRNIPNEVNGLYLIGMTEDNILVVIDMAGKSAADMEKIIKDRKIRDAISWQEEATEKNNHFVSLIINGESRQMSGFGSGMNPRTAIGQRADGAMLLLVTDGRGTNGHLGASAADLISIMEEYGAVNAVNLDGGSSSCMYYNGEYLRDSVTFYYRNSTWRMPYAFLIK